MVSISPRCASVKLCAEAGRGAPRSASASSAGTIRRNEGIRKSSRWTRDPSKKNAWLIGAAGQRLCRDDIVGLDPSGRADREPGFRTRGQLASGLVIAAKEGGLCGGQIGLGVVALPAIGHRELGVTKRRFALPCHGSAQDGNGLVSIGLIFRGHERLPE